MASKKKATKAKDYVDPKCPFCARSNCVVFEVLGEMSIGFRWKTTCAAGVMSRVFKTKDAARVSWGTRGGRIPRLLLSEISAKARISRVDSDPTAKIAGREIGGNQGSARRRAELEGQAAGLSSPSEEAMAEARNVNRTGMADRRIENEKGTAPF